MILLSRSTRSADDHRLELQDKPASRQHRPSTAAKELGLEQQDADLTAAAWNVMFMNMVTLAQGHRAL